MPLVFVKVLLFGNNIFDNWKAIQSLIVMSKDRVSQCSYRSVTIIKDTTALNRTATRQPAL
jgi:hypothetical protein